MVYISQLVTSFVASAAFGIMFNAPKESLVKCGISGMLGWMVYFILEYNGYGTILATLAASFLIAVISQVMAKHYKTPIIIFSVAGIIPLVPGGLSYDAMRHFVEKDYIGTVTLAAKASMISGALAVGLVFSEVLNLVIRRSGKAPK
ncbi:threonine/serine exporter family protein [Mesobacillus zeae]|uniref:Threonine/serine exporter n=1 Tax=Mesobacillus zeae TaxID=1917180 RepID=A0A398B3R0_9BACI|nr:threonine/serine exporter family protein [Mesobacillus zeae]RID84442.1 threonine/serine exporter [Mesobacillus zeae]